MLNMNPKIEIGKLRMENYWLANIPRFRFTQTRAREDLWFESMFVHTDYQAVSSGLNTWTFLFVYSFEFL